MDIDVFNRILSQFVMSVLCSQFTLKSHITLDAVFIFPANPAKCNECVMAFIHI